jgi:hypothetical protein
MGRVEPALVSGTMPDPTIPERTGAVKIVAWLPQRERHVVANYILCPWIFLDLRCRSYILCPRILLVPGSYYPRIFTGAKCLR